MLKTKKNSGYATSKLNEFSVPEKTLVDTTVYRYILDCNKDNMAGTAFRNEFMALPFGGLFQQADRIADLLQSFGIKSGDTIMTLSLDKTLSAELLLAASKIGVQVVVMYPLVSEKNVANLINRLNIKMFFISETMISDFLRMECIHKLEILVALPMGREHVINVRGITSGFKNTVMLWNEFLSSEIKVKANEVQGGDYPLMVCGSSGSTGEPKLIVHTNRSIVASIIQKKCGGMNWDRSDSIISSPPPFVVSAIACLTLAPLACGTAVVADIKNRKEGSGVSVSEKYDYEKILKYKASIVITTKSEMLSMVSQTNDMKLDLSFIKHVFILGESVNIREANIIREYLTANNCNIGLENMYGMSELTAFCYHGSGDGPEVYKFHMLPYTFTSAFDPVTGEECPYGVPGILHVRSSAMVSGYLFDAERTSQLMQQDQDGNIWVRTGDLGYTDENGLVCALGRYEDNYTDNSGNIVFPYMIADVLMNDDNFISCKLTVNDTEDGRKLAMHVHVKAMPENPAEYARHLDDMLRNSEIKSLYPDMYKIRTSMPMVRSKTSTAVLNAETDGFISVR